VIDPLAKVAQHVFRKRRRKRPGAYSLLQPGTLGGLKGVGYHLGIDLTRSHDVGQRPVPQLVAQLPATLSRWSPSSAAT
jgi:hypothetical protein